MCPVNSCVENYGEVPLYIRVKKVKIGSVYARIKTLNSENLDIVPVYAAIKKNKKRMA